MSRQSLRADLTAAAAVTMMSVPQGVAYALIAGLPPAAGLYAAAVPAIIASATRSSSHVVTGPTNAVSLLVGVALAGGALEGNPLMIAASLALLVGLLQLGAGLLRLGAVVDYISRPVVLGYITGAGLLIGFGQLGNITGTRMGRGDPLTRATTWSSSLEQADPWSVLLALGTVGVLVALRRWAPKAPGAIVVLIGGILLSWVFDFGALGLHLAGDLAPVSAGLPPLTIPSAEQLSQLGALLPVAVAATVLSLVESSAVARSLATESGERLDMNREFVGLGLGNLGAAFFGGYPVSGSLSRSALNFSSGAQSRWAGVAAGVMMIVVLLVFGPLVDLTPIAVLAGLLLVVAWDLVDRKAIRTVFHSLWADRLAFLATLVGTWTLPLDIAIYLGVGISVALFLRKVRHVRVTELVVHRDRIRESEDLDPPGRCKRVRALHVEGNLFFGAANELAEAIDEAARDPELKVLVLRLKRARGLDYTTASMLMEMRERMVAKGRRLLLVGMTPPTMDLFREVGLTHAFGNDELYPTRTQWFLAMNQALEHGVDLAGGCEPDCPLVEYLEQQKQPVAYSVGSVSVSTL